MTGSAIRELSDFTLHAKKADGVEKGGVYKLKPELVNRNDDPNTLFYVKKMDELSTFREFLGSSIARLFLGDSAPEIFLLKDNQNTIYTASKEIKGFTTLFNFASQSGITKDCYPSGCLKNQNKLLYLNPPIISSDKSEKSTLILFHNSKRINAVADFIEHGDMHTRNYGVNENNSVCLIDFSLSLGKPNHWVANPTVNQNDIELHEFYSAFYSEAASNKEAIYSIISQCETDMRKIGFYTPQLFEDLKFKMARKLDNLDVEISITKFIIAWMKNHRIHKQFNAIDPRGIINAHPNTLTNFYTILFKLNNDLIKNLIVNCNDPQFTSTQFVSDASVYGNLDFIRLIFSIPNINQKKVLQPNHDNKTPLFLALEFGHIHVAMFLLEIKDTDPAMFMEPSQDGNTTLHMAILLNDTQVMTRLLGINGVDVNELIKPNDLGDTPLHLLLKSDHKNKIQMIQFLININGINLNELMKPNQKGNTPLHLALQHPAKNENETTNIVELLLSINTIDLNSVIKPNNAGDNPLHLALRITGISTNETTEIVKLLLNTKGTNKIALILTENDLEEIPFHYPIKFGFIEVFKLFVDVDGIDLNLLTKSDITESNALHYVLNFMKTRDEPTNYIEIAKCILTIKGIDPNKLITPDNQGNTPLHLAAENNLIDIAKLILDMQGIAPNIIAKQNTYMETPLHKATRYGHIEIVRLLLEGKRVNPNQWITPGPAGNTPLHIAAQYNLIEIVNLILEIQGITPDQITSKNEYGQTALYIALKNDYTEIAQILLNTGMTRVTSMITPESNSIDTIIHQFGTRFNTLLNTPLLSNVEMPAIQLYQPIPIYHPQYLQNAHFNGSNNMTISSKYNDRSIQGSPTASSGYVKTGRYTGDQGSIWNAVPPLLHYALGPNRVSGLTTLHRAVARGDVIQMIALLKKAPSLLYVADSRGKKPLHLYFAIHDRDFSVNYDLIPFDILAVAENNRSINELIQKTTDITNAVIKVAGQNHVIRELIEYGPEALKLLSDTQFKKIFGLKASLSTNIINIVRARLKNGFEESMFASWMTYFSSFVPPKETPDQQVIDETLKKIRNKIAEIKAADAKIISIKRKI